MPRDTSDVTDLIKRADLIKNRFPKDKRLTNSRVVQEKITNIIQKAHDDQILQRADDFYTKYINPGKPYQTLSEVAQAIQDDGKKLIQDPQIIEFKIESFMENNCQIDNFLEIFESVFDDELGTFNKFIQELKSQKGSNEYTDLLNIIKNKQPLFITLDKIQFDSVQNLCDTTNDGHQRLRKILIKQLNTQMKDISDFMRNQQYLQIQFQPLINKNILRKDLRNSSQMDNQMIIYACSQIQNENEKQKTREYFVNGVGGQVYFQNGMVKQVQHNTPETYLKYSPGQIHDKLFINIWPMLKRQPGFKTIQQNQSNYLSEVKNQQTKVLPHYFQLYNYIIVNILAIDQMNFWYDAISKHVLKIQPTQQSDISDQEISLPYPSLEKIVFEFCKETRQRCEQYFKSTQLKKISNTNIDDIKKDLQQNVIYFLSSIERIELIFFSETTQKIDFALIDLRLGNLNEPLKFSVPLNSIKNSIRSGITIFSTASPGIKIIYPVIMGKQYENQINDKIDFVKYIYYRIKQFLNKQGTWKGGDADIWVDQNREHYAHNLET